MWQQIVYRFFNVKKIGQFLEVYILHTTNAISFKFVMQGLVYVEHKIYKYGRNPPSGLRDTRGLNQQLSASCK